MVKLVTVAVTVPLRGMSSRTEVASLNHEIIDDSVELCEVVPKFFSEEEEVFDVKRCLFWIEFNLDERCDSLVASSWHVRYFKGDHRVILGCVEEIWNHLE